MYTGTKYLDTYPTHTRTLQYVGGRHSAVTPIRNRHWGQYIAAHCDALAHMCIPVILRDKHIHHKPTVPFALDGSHHGFPNKLYRSGWGSVVLGGMQTADVNSGGKE